MPRRDDCEDDRPKSKKGNGLAIGLAIGGGVLAVVLVGACIVGVVVFRGAKKAAEEVQQQEQTRAAAGAASVATDGPKAPNEGVIELKNAGPIMVDFTANRIAANQKWVGQRVRLAIGIHTIRQDGKDYCLEEWGPGYSYWVSAAHAAEFANLKLETQCIVETTLHECQQGTRGPGGQSLVFKNTRLISVISVPKN